ncbi:uncharacterized protein [Palaemon carinicauda]|uniref:uncharacterized protein n=1 Tax=Palaemon carinicauda TaxID=392227 RepID=UPI0035B624EA
MPQTILASLETPRSRTVDGNCFERGLQAPFSGRSTSLDSCKPGGVVGPQRPPEKSNLGGRSLHKVGEGSNGDCASSGSGVLQSTLPGREGNGRMETSNRPVSPQQIHSVNTIQDGHPKNGHAVLEGRRCHDIHRPQGCLFPSPNSSSKQEVSPGEVGFLDFAVQSPVVRAVHSPPGITKNFYDDLRLGARTGDPSNSVPGRLVTPFCLKGSLAATRRRASSSLQNSGHHRQSGEVSPVPNQQDDVLGDSPGFLTSQGVSISRQADQSGPSSPPLPGGSTQKSKGLAEVDRTPSVLREDGSPRKAEAQEHPVELKGLVGSEKFPKHHCASSTGDQTVPGVVARSSEHSERDATVLRTARASALHRRVKRRKEGWGAHLLGKAARGSWTEKEKALHIKVLESSSQRKLSGVNVGQCHSSGVHKEGRRVEVEGVVRSHLASPEMGRRGTSQTVGEIHSGKEKRASRRPQQSGPSGGDGMVPSPRSGKIQHPKVGFSGNGSLRDEAERATPRILFACPRPKGGIGGRLSAQVGQSGRVRLSSFRSDEASSQQSKDSQQPKDDFGSALVAGERVVRIPKRSGYSPSVASSGQTRPPEAATLSEVPREPSIPSSSRLEVIQHLLKRQGYSTKTAVRMSRYLRQSSTAVYQAKWAAFIKWCASRKIKPLEASVPNIADFLVHLRDELGMSIPAVKGVRAALGQVFLLKGIDLSSSRHISMLIKSFEQSCPPSSPRVPQWDLARVIDMFSKPPFEPLKDIVDRNLTLKVVFLLALASAKRAGEIHGLSYVSYKEISKEDGESPPGYKESFRLHGSDEKEDFQKHHFLLAQEALRLREFYPESVSLREFAKKVCLREFCLEILRLSTISLKSMSLQEFCFRMYLTESVASRFYV